MDMALSKEGFMPECNRSFLRDLKTLDRRLGTKWNGRNFIVTYDRGHGDPVNIYRVKGDDGGFKQPDMRDLEQIKKGDLSTGESMDVRLRKLAYASEQIRAKQQSLARENIRNMTKDDKTYLSQKIGQLTNQSKSNAAFRRVTPKKGKNVVLTA